MLRSLTISTVLSSSPAVTHGRSPQDFILGKQKWKERKVFQMLYYGALAPNFRAT